MSDLKGEPAMSVKGGPGRQSDRNRGWVGVLVASADAELAVGVVTPASGGAAGQDRTTVTPAHARAHCRCQTSYRDCRVPLRRGAIAELASVIPSPALGGAVGKRGTGVKAPAATETAVVIPVAVAGTGLFVVVPSPN